MTFPRVTILSAILWESLLLWCIACTWIYSTYRFTRFNFLGLVLPGYGIPFFINAAIGILTTTFVLLFIKEPEIIEKAPSVTS